MNAIEGKEHLLFLFEQGFYRCDMFHPNIRKSTKWKLSILPPQKRGIGSAEISVFVAGKPLELHHLFHLKHVKWSILVIFDYVLIKERLKRKRTSPNDSTVNLLSQEISSSYSTHIVCKREPPHGRHPTPTSRVFFGWDFPATSMSTSMVH